MSVFVGVRRYIFHWCIFRSYLYKLVLWRECASSPLGRGKRNYFSERIGKREANSRGIFEKGRGMIKEHSDRHSTTPTTIHNPQSLQNLLNILILKPFLNIKRTSPQVSPNTPLKLIISHHFIISVYFSTCTIWLLPFKDNTSKTDSLYLRPPMPSAEILPSSKILPNTKKPGQFVINP